MRFVWGPIPPSRHGDLQAAGWIPFRSVNPRWSAAQALVGILPCLALAGLALQRAAGELPPLVTITILLVPALLIPVHELLHALGYRVGLGAPDLVTGIWPAHGLWYVVYDAPLTRNRVLLMLVAPLLALTVAPLLVAAIVGSPAGGALAYLALMHAALGIGDLLTFARIVRQVPSNALILNNGWVTYWIDAT